MPGCACVILARSSADGTSLSCDHSLSSKGMNSMKRTSIGRERAKALRE